MSDTTTPPKPCGYCRRCALHDDPGGCLTVEAWERENPEAALASIAAAMVEPFGFYVYDEWDNGEFLTGAKVALIERNTVVHTETFVASSEDAPGDGFSAYGNGRDNHASTQARSYAWGWMESMEASLEDRLAPFGPEFIREMEAEGVPF